MKQFLIIGKINIGNKDTRKEDKEKISRKKVKEINLLMLCLTKLIKHRLNKPKSR